jgi:extracellular matrix regulatory protein A
MSSDERALRMLNVGYGNVVAAPRVVSVVSPQSAPMKRLREQAEKRGKLIDATQGRRTRSILILDTDHIVLSAVNPDTILARLASGEDTPE